jgi:hypothetical protein
MDELDISELISRAQQARLKAKKERKRIGRPPGRRNYDDETLKAIAEDYDKGLTWQEIREKYKVSHKTISKAISRYSKWGLVGGGKRTFETVVRAHRRNRLTTIPLQICRLFDITPGTKLRWGVKDDKIVVEVVKDETTKNMSTH